MPTSFQNKVQDNFQANFENEIKVEKCIPQLQKFFVNKLKEQNIEPSYSLLKTFSKIISHEFRNLNSHFIFKGEDCFEKKYFLMNFMLDLTIENITPSKKSREKQEEVDKTTFSYE